MKIGIDARYLASSYSGIGVYSENLLKALDRLDSPYEYAVFVHESFNRRLSLGENFEVVKVASRPMSRGTFFGETLRAYEEAELDLLHVHFPLLPVRWEGPTIVTVHDLQPFTVPDFTSKRLYPMRKAYDLFYRWAYPASFAKADTILADSRATLDSLYRLFPDAARKAMVVHPGLAASWLDAPPPKEELENVRLKYRLPEKYVLYIGSTRPNKNIPNMLRAFAAWIEKSGDQETGFVLVVSKDRFFRDCERLVATLGLGKRVLVLGQIRSREKRAVYLLARALFFATKSEGFGFPVLEAQASDCPVVVADEDSLPEVAADAAIYVDPDDPADMAEGLGAALNDDDARRAMIELGRENCRRFTWDKCAQETHDVYELMFDPESFTPTDRLAPDASLPPFATSPSRRLLPG
jgi:glycosyltransferase involved in cell wall biosynthesis